MRQGVKSVIAAAAALLAAGCWEHDVYVPQAAINEMGLPLACPFQGGRLYALEVTPQAGGAWRDLGRLQFETVTVGAEAGTMCVLTRYSIDPAAFEEAEAILRAAEVTAFFNIQVVPRLVDVAYEAAPNLYLWSGAVRDPTNEPGAFLWRDPDGVISLAPGCPGASTQDYAERVRPALAAHGLVPADPQSGPAFENRCGRVGTGAQLTWLVQSGLLAGQDRAILRLRPLP